MVSKRERIAQIDPDILLADGFDDALMGVVERKGQPPAALYDRQRCIAVLMDRDGMTLEEAEEYFDFNVTDAYVGERTPAFLYALEPEPETVEVPRDDLEMMSSMVCEHGREDGACMDPYGPYPPCGDGGRLCNSCWVRQWAEKYLEGDHEANSS